jgi:hypothetical protein
MDELKKWLSTRLDKGRNSLITSIRNSKKIQNDIINETKFLNDVKNITFSQRAFHIINDIYIKPLCEICKEKSTLFEKQTWTYRKYCSKSCYYKVINNTLKNTMLEKYNVDNFAKTDLFKKMMIEKNMLEYGVEYYQKTEDFKNKSEATCLHKYNNIKFQSTDLFKEKFKKTCMEKYGVEHYSKTNEFKNKFENTCLEKYGRKTTLFLNNKFKEYILPSGKKIKIQGYENYALDELLKHYEESDILICEEITPIEYYIDDIKHNYYPDFYIKSINKIIEVKSKYFYNIEIDKNLKKRDACLNNGMDFSFCIIEIYKKKPNIKYI